MMVGRLGMTANGWRGTAVALVAMAALARLIPHPPNVAPIAAMALFGGAVIGRPLFAFGVPLLALALSDLVLNALLVGNAFAPPDPFVYGSFLLIGVLGFALRSRRSIGTIAVASVIGSTLFFVVTNFGVWATSHLYPRTAAGLGASYVAALPFFWPTLVGDLCWAGVLFGAWALAGLMASSETGRQTPFAGR